MSNTAEKSVVIRNIYYMLAYAYKSLDVSSLKKLGAEDFQSFHDMLAAMLCVLLAKHRRDGLNRAYVEMSETLLSPRGRISVNDTVRLKAARRQGVACEFDEFSVNTYENQILKTSMIKLLSASDVSRSNKQGLKGFLLGLGDVGELDNPRIDWGRLSVGGRSHYYKLLMGVCYLIISNKLISDTMGNSQVADFMDSQQLHRLYQNFLLAYFQKHHPGLKARARMVNSHTDEDAPDFLPQLLTDIVLTGNGQTLIIDAKCYGTILKAHFDGRILSPDNRNQIYSYVLHEAFGSSSDVAGMLLYAKTVNEEVHASWEETGHKFYCETLDLGMDFAGISEQLDRIAALVS